MAAVPSERQAPGCGHPGAATLPPRASGRGRGPDEEGSATIMPNAPALPAQLTSIRVAPAQTEQRATGQHHPSLARTTTTSQMGMAPMATAPMTARTGRTPGRPGVGHLAERADLVEMPGDIAVEAVGEAERRQQEGGGQPSRCRWGWASRTTKTGRQASRRALRALGTVRTRSSSRRVLASPSSIRPRALRSQARCALSPPRRGPSCLPRALRQRPAARSTSRARSGVRHRSVGRPSPTATARPRPGTPLGPHGQERPRDHSGRPSRARGGIASPPDGPGASAALAAPPPARRRPQRAPPTARAASRSTAQHQGRAGRRLCAGRRW